MRVRGVRKSCWTQEEADREVTGQSRYLSFLSLSYMLSNPSLVHFTEADPVPLYLLSTYTALFDSERKQTSSELSLRCKACTVSPDRCDFPTRRPRTRLAWRPTPLEGAQSATAAREEERPSTLSSAEANTIHTTSPAPSPLSSRSSTPTPVFRTLDLSLTAPPSNSRSSSRRRLSLPPLDVSRPTPSSISRSLRPQTEGLSLSVLEGRSRSLPSRSRSASRSKAPIAPLAVTSLAASTFLRPTTTAADP
jgi:hypothetical protein